MNYQKICIDAVILSVGVGDFITDSRKKFKADDIETKSEHNYVTSVDKESERQLIEGLSKILPGSGFIAEEGTVETEDKEFIWVIDPLDGTTNFIHGLPPFCISIGLLQNKIPVAGIIHDPTMKETFYAWKDGPAHMNGKVIHVSKTKSLDNSLIATGFPYTDYGRLDEYMELFKWCMKNTRGVRRLGSAAIDLAYVACGRVDGFFEYGLSPWDVAAGVFIVQQAGGKVTDFKGGNDYIFGKELVAFNADLQDDFVKVVGEFMG
jgi:myo-inositol-1(or 4)-monophosphatase